MTRSITAMFDTRAEADQAVEALIARAGVDRGRIGVHAQDGGTAAPREEQKGFLDSLAELFMPSEDRHAYAEGIRRGGYLVVAQVEEARLDTAMDVLEQHGAVDLDQREQAWRAEGWGTDQAAAGGIGTKEGPEEGRIPLAEETLRVGKREVDRGRVRVRSYVVETPVEQQVTLREERLDVERRPADRPVTGDDAFRERVVEVSETGEVPVVQKEARVNEEVVVHKEAGERTETVRDTVRHTEVKVDDDTRRGTPGAAPGAAARPDPDRR